MKIGHCQKQEPVPLCAPRRVGCPSLAHCQWRRRLVQLLQLHHRAFAIAIAHRLGARRTGRLLPPGRVICDRCNSTARSSDCSAYTT